MNLRPVLVTKWDLISKFVIIFNDIIKIKKSDTVIFVGSPHCQSEKAS